MKPIWKFAFILLFLSGCTTLYNPATGQREYIYISTESELAMGRDMHEQLSEQFSFIEKGKQLERLRRIGNRLAKVSDRQDYDYQFFLIDKEEMNAFTTPGGRIYFFRGLLNQLKDDDAVAGVLAHEIGHCAARHVVKKYQAAMGYNLIGTLVFSQIKGASAQEFATKSTGALMQLIFSAYSRQDEYESDQLGVKYMRLAGYNPEGMIRVFEVLKQASQGGDVPLMLRSHPHLDDRIDAVEGMLQ